MNDPQPLVKICGVREPEHARIAVEAGADLIGIVFAESHRRVGVDEARRIVAAVRESDHRRRVKVAGLFVNEPVDHMNRVAETVGLDLIQLSGDESPDLLGSLNRPAIGSVRASNENREKAGARFEAWFSLPQKPWAIIVDTHVPGIYGGTGRIGDWDLARSLARRYPLILAGGLNPENVTEAIETVHPFAVDVSSGVETDRRKDADKIRAFLAAARSARRVSPVPSQEEGRA